MDKMIDLDDVRKTKKTLNETGASQNRWLDLKMIDLDITLLGYKIYVEPVGIVNPKIPNLIKDMIEKAVNDKIYGKGKTDDDELLFGIYKRR